MYGFENGAGSSYMNTECNTGHGKSSAGGTGAKHIPVGWGVPTHFKVPIPINEPERMATLRSYQILDTPPEDVFNDIVTMAAYICGTPIAMISLVDSNRQWFKAKVGLTATETARDVAFCAHAIMQEDLFVVPDAIVDERFALNPLVTTDPKIRFYAGAPLLSADRHAIGTLCVIDRVPRHLSAEQKDALKALSRQVIALLELRKEVQALRRGRGIRRNGGGK
jgi:GAF domain-containing protein